MTTPIPVIGQDDPIVCVLAATNYLDDEGVVEAITSLQGVLRRRREGRAMRQQAQQQAAAKAKSDKRKAWRVVEGGAR
jgi:hypothetical protein